MTRKRKVGYIGAAVFGMAAVSGLAAPSPEQGLSQQPSQSEYTSSVLSDVDQQVAEPQQIEPVVEVKIETSTELIEHETETTYSSSYNEGTRTVEQEGRNGERTVTHEVRYVDGEEADRTEVSDVVSVVPVSEIIVIGTKKLVQAEPTQEQPTPQVQGSSDSAASSPEPVQAEEPAAGCSIKGNISYTTGEKIYHVPGQQYYDRTVIDTSDGERWFCSEDAAMQAGWRKSKR